MRGLIRIAGVDPTRRSLCYAVLEGEDCLLAWGCTRAPKLYAKRIRKAAWKLLDEFQPDFVVLESPEASRRGRRARRAIEILRFEALEYGAGVRLVSRQAVRAAFAPSAITKHEIAQRIAKHFPELRRSLPVPRRLGDSEQERMNVFDAASFALTAFPEIEHDRISAA